MPFFLSFVARSRFLSVCLCLAGRYILFLSFEDRRMHAYAIYNVQTYSGWLGDCIYACVYVRLCVCVCMCISVCDSVTKFRLSTVFLFLRERVWMVNEIKSKSFVRVRFHIFCLCVDVFDVAVAVAELNSNRCARPAVKIPTQKSRLKNPDSSSNKGSSGKWAANPASQLCRIFRHLHLH